MGKINRTQYHELDLLLWDIHKNLIEAKTAFELYERRWGYVDQNKLTNKEKALIAQLTQVYGNGHFMPAV